MIIEERATACQQRLGDDDDEGVEIARPTQRPSGADQERLTGQGSELLGLTAEATPLSPRDKYASAAHGGLVLARERRGKRQFFSR